MTDYEYLLSCLYEYMHRQSYFYENDLIQLSNNVAYRKADPLDHLEMIMAQTRYACALDIFADIYQIIAICRKGRYNG